MNAPLVLREDKDSVCTLTINRPDKLNSLNVPVFEELRAHIIALQEDDSVNCVVLRGAGKCFSAGHDLADIEEGEDVSSPFWHSETLRMLERLPKPVIAAVHGHCYTGALEVALAADFIVASDTARFGDTHAKWALTPVWGMSQRLPRRVGAGRAVGRHRDGGIRHTNLQVATPAQALLHNGTGTWRRMVGGQLIKRQAERSTLFVGKLIAEAR